MLPAALREVGLVVYTLADIYGEQQAQLTPDAEWIHYASDHNLAVLCKDDWIRRRRVELDALVRGRVRAFCLTNGNLTFREQADRFVTHRFRIIQRAGRPGPFVDGVYADGIRRLWPV